MTTRCVKYAFTLIEAPSGSDNFRCDRIMDWLEVKPANPTEFPATRHNWTAVLNGNVEVVVSLSVVTPMDWISSREKFLAVLAKAPDVEPEEYDRLPDNLKPAE